jgi:hypothetical protein
MRATWGETAFQCLNPGLFKDVGPFFGLFGKLKLLPDSAV